MAPRNRYEKDYDAIPGEGPLQWARRFDVSRWGLFTARMATRLVVAAAVAIDTPGLPLLEGRRDLALSGGDAVVLVQGPAALMDLPGKASSLTTIRPGS